MKKTLIAIAALVATGAFAQSSVTISGTFDAGLVNSEKASGNATANSKGMGFVHNLTATSGIAFTGSSDLGAGLRAEFKIGTDFNPMVASAGDAYAVTASGASPTVTSFANAENKFGLRGGLGYLGFGAINNLALEAHLTATAFGTAIGSGYKLTSTSTYGGNARNDNTVRYDSPVFAGGMSFSYVGRKQQVAGTQVVGLAKPSASAQQSGVSEIGLRYSAGPLNVIAAQATEDGLNVFGDKGTVRSISANYNMGAPTLYFGWQGQKGSNAANAATADLSGMTFGAKYSVGANTVMASLGRATNNMTGMGNANKNFALGYEYALAKATAVTARYEKTTSAAGLIAGSTANVDGNRFGVGIRTAF